MPRLSVLYRDRLEARRRQIDENILAMAEVINQAQREVLSVPYPPASRPGMPAHRRSGRLQAGAGTKVDLERGSIQLINTAPHAPYLRDGTSRMVPRPWQDAALERARPQLEALRQRNMPFGRSE